MIPSSAGSSQPRGEEVSNGLQVEGELTRPLDLGRIEEEDVVKRPPEGLFQFCSLSPVAGMLKLVLLA